MTNALGAAYRYAVALMFLAVLVQFGAAGYGAFDAGKKADDTNALSHKAYEHGFDFHKALGSALVIGGLVVLLCALGAQLGRSRILLALGLPVLVVLTLGLATAGEKHPVVGIFHPVVALLVAGLSGYLAHAAWSRKAAVAA